MIIPTQALAPVAVDGRPVCQWLVLHSAMYFNPPRVLLAIDMRRRLQYRSAGTQLLGVRRPQTRKVVITYKLNKHVSSRSRYPIKTYLGR